ncbi:unnamed protein product [Phytophthora fragariaefolia]|uniref:Unnamed protein product n=1 Tax=Phytophthora fragariaefolia TaxID=1490495 RepID=A0A9W6YM28_9STRA|nr:unnamed protein product [Phytophthora fragariaefolia]
MRDKQQMQYAVRVAAHLVSGILDGTSTSKPTQKTRRSSEKSQDDNVLAIPHEIKHAIKAEAAPTTQDWVRTKGGSSSKREKETCQSPDQQGIHH